MQTMFRKSLIASAIAIAMSGAVWAAQDQGQNQVQNQDQNPVQNQGQNQGQQPASKSFDTGSKIQVKEAPAQVQVTQPEPKITVEQSAPKVTVEQPEPKVQVTQPKPLVQVEEAQPEVKVIDQGKPQVEIKEAGQPQVNVQTPGDRSTLTEGDRQNQNLRERSAMSDRERIPASDMGEPARSTAAAPAEGRGYGGAAWLSSMTVSDITGKEVKNKNGDELGDVQRVVVDPRTNSLYAIVSVGGFLGIGDKLIPMELDQMTMSDDDLIAPTWASEDQLKSRQAFEPSQFRELDNSQMLGELMGSPGGGQGTRFSSFDKNNDGVISWDEASGYQMLTNNWQSIDANNNKQIDRSEFSAFEASANQR